MKWYLLTYWHDRNIYGIRFLDGMRLRMLLSTYLSNPEYVLDKKVSKDINEIDVAHKQVLKKQYSMTIPAHQRSVDAFNLIRMCRYVTLTDIDTGDIMQCYDFDVETAYVDSRGMYANLQINFTSHPVVDAGCSDDNDLYPTLAWTVAKKLVTTDAAYTSPNSAMLNYKYFIATTAEDALQRAGKIQYLLSNAGTLTWHDFEDWNNETWIITNNNDSVKWYYNGAYWHNIPTILLSNSGNLITVKGEAVRQTLCKIEYKTGANPYTLVGYYHVGQYNDGSISFNTGSSATWTIQVTCLTNSGTYQALTNTIAT